MKVVHLSLSSGGGAGAAARRTVEALSRHGVDAQLWTNDGVKATRALRSRGWSDWRRRMDRSPLGFYRNRRFYSVWSNGWLPSRLTPALLAARPDVIHLHWIGDGFIDLREFDRLSVPLVWTLHDAWGFTGGCHYPGDCVRFRDGCGCCPQLGSTKEKDLSTSNFGRKSRVAEKVARWIAPSAWLGELAISSGLASAARVRIIPNGFDGEIFRLGNGLVARERLGLSSEAFVLVAGATDLSEARKGAGLLADAVRRVQRVTGRTCVLVVFGGKEESLCNVTGVETRFVGTLRGEAEMAAVLALADVLLLPSLQDNLPNIAVEAQACGCPVIGFDTGGLKEIILSGVTGSLASEVSSEALAEATVKWIQAMPARSVVAKRCRERFEARFTYATHAKQLVDLYGELLEGDCC